MRFVFSPSSRSTHAQQRSRGFLAVGATFLAVLMLAVFTAGPASAHNALTTTDPQDGATLSEAPAQIILTFDDNVIEVGSLISVTGPDGDELVDGDVAIDRNVATQALVADLPAADYEVLWRVTSADGHPIDGEFTFTTENAVSAEEPTEDVTEPTVEPIEDPTEEATEAEATEETTPADDATSANADVNADDSDADGMSTGLLITVVIVGLILGAIAVLLVNKNRKAGRNSEASDETNSGNGTDS